MSKNLIIDYLAGIEVQMNSLKKLLNDLNKDSHNLNFVNIRNQKAKMADFLNDEVVDISSSKYIRDENRIIISAPEIIIGNVDKNGNLIASDGTSKVVIRANQVGLEGVSKDDSLIGVVRTRAPRIHHVAVDPGIDGNENYVGSTSEILSYAKGIELRCEHVSPSLKQYGIPGRARLFEVIQKVNEINAQRKINAPGHKFTCSSYDDIALTSSVVKIS